MDLKINKHIPVLLDCYCGDKLVGTVSNSIELFDFRLQVIDQKLNNCSIRISKNNTNFDYIDDDERDIVININELGEVDKWFTEDYLEGMPINVYSESLNRAIRIRHLQKYGK